MKTVRPILGFRVYPSKGARLYFTVFVFNTRPEMHRFAKTMSGYENRHIEGDVSGLCRSWERERQDSKGVWRLRPNCGVILLMKDRLQPDVVAHEVTHAALVMGKRKKLNPYDESRDYDKNQQEWICYAIGDMTHDIYRHARKAGLIQ